MEQYHVSFFLYFQTHLMQDAHLHLQDTRFQDVHAIIAEMQISGVTRCVVNGTSPADWEQVRILADHYPDFILPSYGLHPWKVPIDQDWKSLLREYLKNAEIPCIGECGLDRWVKDFNIPAQQDAFLFQLDLACEMNAPITIHILKAWGWFMEILRVRKSNHLTTGKFFPERGFLLHSFNGSADLVAELVAAGAYFSFSGYFFNQFKKNQLDVFLNIPIERLLIETDAPDMLPPNHIITHPLEILNHPANLRSIFEHFSKHLDCDQPTLESQLTKNFTQFFLSKSAFPQ